MAASGSPAQILRSVPGALGTTGRRRAPDPAVLAAGRQLAGMGSGRRLPDGAQPVAPDFEDAVVAAALASEQREVTRWMSSPKPAR